MDFLQILQALVSIKKKIRPMLFLIINQEMDSEKTQNLIPLTSI